MSSNGRATDSQSITAGREIWERFASDVIERLLSEKEALPQERQQLGSYLRALRYRRGIGLSALADALGLTHEQVALLEQGLLKPSELTPEVWMRLMGILDGRESLEKATPSGRSTPAAEAAKPEAAQSAPVVREAPTPTAMEKGKKEGRQIGVARIKVIGVGGGGSNAVARMYRQRIPGVEYAVVNTDQQHLQHLEVPVKLRIGDKTTRGLGVGGNPEVGRKAALESRDALAQLVSDADMVFIAAGMGGGTGTGAAPVLAQLAKEAGVLTIAAVTKPFTFEGRRRMRQAEEGIVRMREQVDTLIIIPNDRLSAISEDTLTAENAFRMADDVLRQGVQSIAELITVPGEINLDFADVKTVMHGAGPAWMAIGYGRGENRAVDAARDALASPLLDIPVESATRVLLNIAGGPDLRLHEVHRAADFVARAVDPDANIIFGMVTDVRMDEEIRVTVIATGLRSNLELFNEAVAQLTQAQSEREEPEPESESEQEEEAAPERQTEQKPSFWQRLGFGRK